MKKTNHEKEERHTQEGGGSRIEILLEAMQSDFQVFGESLEVLDEKFTKRFDEVDQRFDGVDQRFDAIDRRFDAMDQRFDKIEGRLDRLEAEIRDMRAILGTPKEPKIITRSEYAALERRLSAVERALAEQSKR